MIRRLAAAAAMLSLAAVLLPVLRAGQPRPAAAQPPGAGQTSGSARPAGAAAPAAAPVDSFAAERDSLMQVVLKSIAGREEAPAESVFKDIKITKGMPAGRVVRIMNMGFGRSLGVGCQHCHDVSDWAKDAKPQKRIAREMWAMVGTINGEILSKIEGLQSERPVVNCTTCHRGAVKPATNL